jgi:phage protein D
MTSQDTASKAEVRFAGSSDPLPPGLQLRQVAVDHQLMLPDAFEVRFSDERHPLPDDRSRGSGSILQQAGIVIGAEVEIKAAPAGGGTAEMLIKGEVTSIEGMYDTAVSYVLVRGYDKSHRLHRGQKTKAYIQETDQKLVSDAASDAGVSTGTVDDPGVTKDHFSWVNLTGWELVQSRAKGTGREALVTDGKLEFRKPTEASTAQSTDPFLLEFPGKLLSFNPRVTAPQYGQAAARGWDPVKKEPVTATAPITATNASLNKTPPQLANLFGSPVFLQPTPLSIAKEVEDTAKALAEQIGSTFAEAEATTKGHPKLKAGTAVEVKGVSQEFAGKWTITASRHVISWDEGAEEPYLTYLTMSGRQDRSLLGLTTPERANGALGSGEPIYGVVVGQVEDTKDPDKRGRVKVWFPWLTDKSGAGAFVSDWAWVVQPGAGKDRGMMALPEVDDIVLVGFFMGNPRFPYVIGNLYNGVDKPITTDGDPLTRDGDKMPWTGYVSRTGHALVFQDKDDFVQLRTAGGKTFLKLDKKGTIIELEGEGKITIHGAQDITVKGDANIKVEAGANLEEKATGNVNIEASGNMTLKAGGMMNVEASGMTTIKGATIQLN